MHAELTCFSLELCIHPLQHYTPLIHACKMIPEVEVSQEKRRQTVEYLLEKGTCALPSNESEVNT